MKKKSITLLVNSITTICILIGIISFIAVLQSKSGQAQPPTLLNHQFMTVLSGSMEPLLEPGDLIIIKQTNQAERNDVVTYQKSNNTYVTHRVTEIVKENGTTALRTKGDANNVADADLVHLDQLVGTLAFTIPNGGYIIQFLKSPIGIITVISAFIVVITIWKTIQRHRNLTRKGSSSSLSNGKI